jgi:hypothetical protein
MKVECTRTTTHHSQLTTRYAPRGVALMGAVVVLTVVSALMMAMAWQILANRRMLEHRTYELQAQWLARAGAERAADRLLVNPHDYQGESFEPVELSSVRIEITAEPDSTGRFRVICEARYPTDADDMVVRSVTRRVERLSDGTRVRLRVIAEN